VLLSPSSHFKLGDPDSILGRTSLDFRVFSGKGVKIVGTSDPLSIRLLSFPCKRKFWPLQGNLQENGKEFCCQEGNKKDITLFLINPKITAISKQIRFRKCRKSCPGEWKI
jgi:hypothetical protein